MEKLNLNRELDIQKFLRSHPDNWYQILKKSPFELIIHEKDNLVIFKYVQFASDFTKELVRESRGLILEKGTWDVVCLPFSKFFNYGEPNAYDIDFSKSYVLEKVDGSIIKVYYYNGEWRVATNGTIDASDAFTMGGDLSFKDLFFDVISEKRFAELTDQLETECTYLFELIHPASRVVVDYKNKKELVFIGTRHNQTLNDASVFELSYYKSVFDKFQEIRYPKKYDVDTSLDKLQEYADSINTSGNDFEGFIVAEVDNWMVKGRVKIKSVGYLRLHRLTGSVECLRNSIIELLLDGEQDEVEAYIKRMPDITQKIYIELAKKFDNLVNELTELLNTYAVKARELDRKNLALLIQKEVPAPFRGFIFFHIDKGKTAIELLRERGVKQIKNLLYLL